MRGASRLAILFLALAACGEEAGEAPEAGERAEAPKEAKAPAEVGPDGPEGLAIPKIDAIPTDAETIAKGEATFTAKGCPACHQFGTKLVGPDLIGVTQRRSTPWLEKMILHPDAMLAQDPVAKQLLGVHMTRMPDQGVADEEVAPLLAYIRSKGG